MKSRIKTNADPDVFSYLARGCAIALLASTASQPAIALPEPTETAEMPFLRLSEISDTDSAPPLELDGDARNAAALAPVETPFLLLSEISDEEGLSFPALMGSEVELSALASHEAELAGSDRDALEIEPIEIPLLLLSEVSEAEDASSPEPDSDESNEGNAIEGTPPASGDGDEASGEEDIDESGESSESGERKELCPLAEPEASNGEEPTTVLVNRFEIRAYQPENEEDGSGNGGDAPAAENRNENGDEGRNGNEGPSLEGLLVGDREIQDGIREIATKYEGQELTLEQLQAIADCVTQEYLRRDYITTRAILPDQTINDGIVEIQVIEGRLSETIEVEGDRLRINESYITKRILLGANVPLNTAELEEQLRLLRADPLFENVEASLRRGDKIDESKLIVRVTEANPFTAIFSADNYSPPSIASERFGSFLRFRNLTGLGDEVSASYNFTRDNGADNFDFSYRIPLNPLNGTLQLRAAPSRNEIVQEPFNEFDIRGDRELYEVNFRQPLRRSPREEFALSLGLTYQEGQTFTFQGPTPFGIGPDEDGISRTSVLKFAQEYIRREASGAWVFRSQFNLGLDIFDATDNDNPIPDGEFFSWTAQAQRVERLGRDHLAIVQLDMQFTPDSLLPAEQFVIGGGQSLRGYRQNVRSADNGVRFSAEGRFTVARNASGAPALQLAPFFDMGGVWNVSENPNSASLPDERFLAGLGLGLLWEPLPRFRIRLDYAIPLMDIDDRGDNIQDDGLYFSVNYQPF